MEKNYIIDMRNIVKNYFIDTPNEIHVLKSVDLRVRAGEFVSIVGASGSGKSTLMNIIGALDRPTSGNYTLDGIPLEQMLDNELSGVRNQKIGFVFQTFNLIPRTSALKNVELPMLYAGMDKKRRTERAKELLNLVGMSDRVHFMPNELSGGQRQRVAIARSLANDPAIILADEPTGALDSQTGHLVVDLFHKIHMQERKTIILITHNKELALETQRIVTIRDGEIVKQKCNQSGFKRYENRHGEESLQETGNTHDQEADVAGRAEDLGWIDNLEGTEPGEDLQCL